MPNDTLSVLTIAAMALMTYMTRASGMWLMGLVTPSRRVEAWLHSIPGAVLVALIAPTVFTSGLAEFLAAGATVLVAARTKNVLLAMLVGVGIVVLIRHIF